MSAPSVEDVCVKIDLLDFILTNIPTYIHIYNKSKHFKNIVEIIICIAYTNHVVSVNNNWSWIF